MPKRGSIASCACANCRKRKTKCDATRPTCRTCEQKRIECRYEVEEGLTRSAALKRKLKQLELDYGSAAELHSQLKHGEPDEVVALVNRIRTEDSLNTRATMKPGGITDDDDQDKSQSSKILGSHVSWNFSSNRTAGFDEMQQSPSDANPSPGMMNDDFPIDPALSGVGDPTRHVTSPRRSIYPPQNPSYQDPSFQMHSLPIPIPTVPSVRQYFQIYAPSLLRSSLPILRHGMAFQINSMPGSCSAYTEAQIESLIFGVEMQADHDIPRSQLCELSSIATVAAQYVPGYIQPPFIDFFYDAARHFFEDCMESPPPHLLPLKICAMLALANILSKPFLASTYIDLGLLLAPDFSDPAASASQNAFSPDFAEAKRVRGILHDLRDRIRVLG